MKSLVEFSIKNPILVNLVFVFIMIAGGFSMFQMQREAYPRFSFDTVIITTLYPGATPAEIEKLITIPIEKEIKQVADIKEASSVSAEGISVITIKIEEDTSNKDVVVNEIQRAVDRVDDFPLDLKEKPVVKDIKTEDYPIIEVSLSGNLKETELQEYAKALEKRLLDISDVSRIDRSGYRDRQIWVELKPDTILLQHITINEVAKALNQQNKTIPGGKYYLNHKEHHIKTTGEIKDENDAKDTIVRASMLGKWLSVADVATVQTGFEENATIQKTMGTRSINLIIVKKEQGDTINLVKKTKKIAEEFKQATGGKLEINYLNDLSFFVERRQGVLINNGIYGIIFVVIFIFLFLSTRTAIGACFGIPTAIFLTFAVMHYLNISFNLISMFGLIMVVGMLVDEDIVISENIHRHMEDGKSTENATVTGVSEVIGPIVATILTTIAAFIPIFMMGGIMGKFTKPIPIVVTIALVSSLFQALVILPSHIHDLHKEPDQQKKPNPAKKTHTLIKKTTERYKIIIEHGMKFRYRYFFGIVIVFFICIILATTSMKFILFPSKGIELFYVKVELPQGMSLEQTNNKMSEIEKLIAGDLKPEELNSFTTEVGMIRQDPNDPQTTRASHVAQIKVFLSPEPDRERSTNEIIANLRAKTKTLTGFDRVDFEMQRYGPPVGKPVLIRIRGDDFTVLKKLSTDFQQTLKEIQGVTDIKDDYDVSQSEIKVVINPVKAAQTGLTLEHIASTVRNAFEGLIATTIKTSEEETDIIVKYPAELKYDAQALETLLIPNNFNQLIKLSHVAHFETSKGMMSIKHFDNIRAVNVTANVDEEIITPMGVSKIIKPLIEKLKKENPALTIHFGGEVEETSESLSNLFHAFYLAAALIFLIVMATTKSFLQTIISMSIIPLSVIGVILAFNLHNEPLSFMAILGIIGLTGVVGDSALLMIDLTNRLKIKGMSTHEAIINGSALRLRSVILTSLTNFVGILPAGYGFGGRDPFIQPMAMAMSYGILFGAALTIFFVPVFLAIVDDAQQWGNTLRKRISQRLAFLQG